MSNVPKPPIARRPKSNNALVYVILAIVGGFGLLVFSCCLCGPIASLFIETDLEKADALWDEGKKAEAVSTYTQQMDRLPTWEKPRVYTRVVAYHFDEGDKDKATRVCIESIQQDVPLKFERQELIDVLAAARVRHAELKKEAEAGVTRRKKEDEAREAEKVAAEQAKVRENLDAYLALLKESNVDIVTNVHVNRDGDLWTATITVKNIWHLKQYQIRLQDAQALWEAWANIASPYDRDSARISIVDLRGNEVGGSRFLGGSAIWVQE